MKKFGFIGCGKMGGCLAETVAKCLGGENVLVCDLNRASAEKIAEKTGARLSDTVTVAKSCDFIVVGVKPQACEQLYSELSALLRERSNAVIITMAAGVSVEAVRSMSGTELPVIRIMPNLAASVGKGVVLYTASGISSECEAEFLNAFSLCGVIDPIPEQLIDAAGSVTGCGPAFVFMFIQSLADAAVKCGVPRDKALLYAEATVSGSAELLLQSGEHPERLKDNVCSPAGTTIAGVTALEERAFRGTVEAAVNASYERTLELLKK